MKNFLEDSDKCFLGDEIICDPSLQGYVIFFNLCNILLSSYAIAFL